ncbi:MAG: glycosyltransferase family 9 protein [Nitrosomonadales bacterium]|nr:glycosyltransferase family 9 protein [Nitrosomonadales bacterium]
MNHSSSPSGFKNVLLIQLGDIGDVVLTTPTIRAVKETYPDARVSILVRKPFGNLLTADPNIHEIVESEKIRGSLFHFLWKYLAFARRLRQAHYDLVIDLRTGDRGAILAFFTGAKKRVGRSVESKKFWRELAFTTTVSGPTPNPENVHPGADQSLHIVREIGITATDSTPQLNIASVDQARALALLGKFGLAADSQWVSVNPCSRWKYKEWGYEKWGEVIDQLWQTHRLPAVLIGSLEETAACHEIVAGREERAFNLAGRTTLGELAAVLQLSSLHLGVDSAAPHIAAAVGTPTVTIFGPGNWRGWTIDDHLHRVVTAGLPCIPCGQKGCEDTGQSRCLDQLDSEAVLEKIYSVMKVVS